MGGDLTFVSPFFINNVGFSLTISTCHMHPYHFPVLVSITFPNHVHTFSSLLFRLCRGILIDFNVASSSSLLPVIKAPGVLVTGTVLFAAISVLCKGGTNTVASDLEALLYSLCYIAADGKLPWSRICFNRAAIVRAKLEFLMHRAAFDDRLSKLGVPCKLRPLLRRLRALFSPEEGAYHSTIDPVAFEAVCASELEQLQQKLGQEGHGEEEEEEEEQVEGDFTGMDIEDPPE